MLLVPALWHAIVAGAFLARAGEGPMRTAPGGLVAGIGWLASVGAVLSAVGSVGTPTTLPLLLWTTLTVGIAALGTTTMWLTRTTSPSPDREHAPRAP